MAIHHITENVLRVLAPNPSPMTLHGTNTYILHDDVSIIVDPGPDLADHWDQLRQSLTTLPPLVAILVTHSHRDHSPLATIMGRDMGVPIYAFGPSGAGKSAFMASLSNLSTLKGGEGVDAEFAPDHRIKDGDTLRFGKLDINAIWTPGHLDNHMCFAFRDVLFSGDHVMGWASSLISPPDGDLTAFMDSCRKLLGVDQDFYLPGHGDPVENGKARVQWLMDHRQSREMQIRASLADGPANADALARAIYHDVNPALLGAAARNVLAHLLDLYQRQIVTIESQISWDSKFILANAN